MRTITCIGYEGHLCGKVVERVSNNSKRCSECALVVRREQHRKGAIKYRREHPNEVREHRAKWYREHPDKVREYGKKYYREHSNEIRKRGAEYRREHSNEIREYQTKWYREHAEHVSVNSHWNYIFGSHSLKAYKGMPFFDGWNPDKGGSLGAGADWIIANLGKRPTEGKYELHIIDRQIGFVPGNLVWVPKDKHKREELLAKSLKRIQELESLVRAA